MKLPNRIVIPIWNQSLFIERKRSAEKERRAREEREADELRKTEERIKQLETSISELDYELEKIELEKSRLKPRIVEDKNISSGL